MFNKKEKTVNSIKASVLGVVYQLLRIIFEFVYRTVFLLILSKEYLGLNGLFTNILTVLSLAELGIGTAIIYRMYKPIKENDVDQVAAIMDFYKKVYRIISLIVLGIGLLMLPFLKFFIKDTSEIPGDINLYIIYSLYLFQSVSSYLFVYKQSLLSADQRGDIVSFIGIILTFFRHAVQIIVLILTRNFTVVLAAGIVAQCVVNYVVSLFVTRRYKEIFSRHIVLDKNIKRQILHDTKIMLCHKIGTTVVFATDSLLLSMFIGVGVLGIYSNYSMIIMAINGLVSQLLSTFVSSIGQLCLGEEVEHQRRIYFNLLFANFWISSFCAVCLFALLNPFITVWQGQDMVLTQTVVLTLCVSSFITINRNITGSFINATGLFAKDFWRPLLEAVINLLASIVLVKFLGLVGIFLGTIISSLSTVFWREPYLLFRNVLKKGLVQYWFKYLLCCIKTIVIGVGLYFLCKLMPNTWGYFFIKFAICIIVPNLIWILTSFWLPEFQYFVHLTKNLLIKLKSKKRA